MYFFSNGNEPYSFSECEEYDIVSQCESTDSYRNYCSRGGSMRLALCALLRVAVDVYLTQGGSGVGSRLEITQTLEGPFLVVSKQFCFASKFLIRKTHFAGFLGDASMELEKWGASFSRYTYNINTLRFIHLGSKLLHRSKIKACSSF